MSKIAKFEGQDTPVCDRITSQLPYQSLSIGYDTHGIN